MISFFVAYFYGHRRTNSFDHSKPINTAIYYTSYIQFTFSPLSVSFLCVHFTFWVACSPVWNSKDTLKLPLLAVALVCVRVCGYWRILTLCWPVFVVAALGPIELIVTGPDAGPVRTTVVLLTGFLQQSAARCCCCCCLWHAKSLPLSSTVPVTLCASCPSMPPRCGESESIFFFSPAPLLYFIVVSFGFRTLSLSSSPLPLSLGEQIFRLSKFLNYFLFRFLVQF